MGRTASGSYEVTSRSIAKRSSGNRQITVKTRGHSKTKGQAHRTPSILSQSNHRDAQLCDCSLTSETPSGLPASACRRPSDGGRGHVARGRQNPPSACPSKAY